MPLSVLLIGDVSARLAPFKNNLPDAVSSVVCLSDLPSSLRDVTDGEVVTTVVVSLNDIEMPPTSIVRRVRHRWPWVSLLLVDAPPSSEMATAALKAGAQDYLAQDRSNAANMAAAVSKTLRSRPFRHGTNPILQYVSAETVIGNSDAMQSVLDRLRTASDGATNVVIQGEPGTGRSLIAHALHVQSSSEEVPLLTLDCRCLSPARARSLLCGDRRTPDAAPMAAPGTTDRGTIVLDHLDEADHEVHDLLIHALDSGAFAAPDSSLSDQQSIQFIGITSTVPASGSLRSALYYRLAELPMVLPPLRERPEDLLPLARHFLLQHANPGNADDHPFSREARTALREYPWPGNVRQLKNVVLLATRNASSWPVERDDLLLPDPAPLPNAHSDSQQEDDTRPPRHLVPSSSTSKTGTARPRRPETNATTKEDIRPLQEVKKQAIKEAYETFDGDVDQAAVALDIGRSTMYRMLKRHDLRDDNA